MIYSSDFRLDHDKKEIFTSYSEEFPYECMSATLDHFIGRGWHWHPAFEIDYVLEGALNFRTPDGEMLLEKGDAIFVNSNVMHDARSASKDKHCKIYAILFGGSLLSGMYGSIYEKKYLFPISGSRDLSAFKIRPDTPQGIHMIEAFLQAVEFTEKEAFGYELEVRSALGRFWCILLKETERIRSNRHFKNDADSERLRQMLQYIHRHYMDKIAICDIAKAANISERECSRCFHRCLNTSPANYLNQYRLAMSARMLLHTNSSILTICEACGFSSGSYFSKLFRTTMGCTPREYRGKQQAGKTSA